MLDVHVSCFALFIMKYHLTKYNYRNYTQKAPVIQIALVNNLDLSSLIPVPPIGVAISQAYTDPLYTGTNQTLTCVIVLNSLVDIPVTVTNQWTRNGTDITEDTITSDLVEDSTLNYTATLVFFPLNHVTDDGEYQCSVQVVAEVIDNNYVSASGISNSASTTLNVLGKCMRLLQYAHSISFPLIRFTQSSSQYFQNINKPHCW